MNLESERQKMLNTGLKIVLSKGFSGLSIKDILSEVQISLETFYAHFPSKEHFGCALLKKHVQEYEQLIGELLVRDGNTGHERLMRYWRTWIDDGHNRVIENHNIIVRLCNEISELFESMRIILYNSLTYLTKRLVQTIIEGQRDGSINPELTPEVTVRSLYNMWLGASLFSKIIENKTPLNDALKATEIIISL